MKIATWNMEQHLSDPKASGRSSWPALVNSLYTIGANIVVIPEAAKGEPERAALTIKRLAEQTGYPNHILTEYEDQSTGGASVYLAVLSRIAITGSEIIRLGSESTARNAIMLDLKSAEFGDFRLLGLHLSDATEEARLDQAASVHEHIDRAHEDQREIIIAGDFNAMHRDDFRAHALRSRVVRALARGISSQKIRSIATRLSAMAEGIALDAIERAGVSDADPRHHATTTPKMRDLPTWVPSVRMAQIDHILHSDGLTPSDYRVHPDGGSDHRPISANFRRITG